jgi:hypothetical protein
VTNIWQLMELGKIISNYKDIKIVVLCQFSVIQNPSIFRFPSTLSVLQSLDRTKYNA